MVEHAMLAELFAVVRCDDDVRIFEQPATIKLIEQRADFPVERRDAVFIRVASELDVSCAQAEFVPVPVIKQHRVIAARFGSPAKAYSVAFRRQKRLVGVEIVQKREERPARGSVQR